LSGVQHEGKRGDRGGGAPSRGAGLEGRGEGGGKGHAASAQEIGAGEGRTESETGGSDGPDSAAGRI
jgi:hypothetical protein